MSATGTAYGVEVPRIPRMAWGRLPAGVCLLGVASIQLFSPESSWTLVSISSRHAVVHGPPIGNGG
jgi:hypothetical protein